MNAKVLTFVVVCLAAFVVASGKKDGGHKPMCLGKAIPSTDDEKATMKTCHDEFKGRKGTGAPGGGKMRFGKDDCFTACTLDKNGFLKDGKLDIDTIDKNIDAKFPEEARAGLKKDYAACSSTINETLSTDNSCKSYNGLRKCLRKAIMSNCFKAGTYDHNPVCLGKKIHSTDDHKADMKACWDEMMGRRGTGAPGGDRIRSGTDACFTACTVTKHGFVKDSKLDTEVIGKYFDAKFPEEARAGLKKDYAACSSSITETLSTENSCKSYDALGKCLVKAMMTNCYKMGAYKQMCLGKEVTTTDDQKTALKTCSEEMMARNRNETIDPKGGRKHFGYDSCFTACKLIKYGSIKDGKLDTDALNKYVEAGYPEEAHAGLKKDIGDCSSSITETLSMDNKCKSYEAVGNCIFKAVMTNCHKEAE